MQASRLHQIQCSNMEKHLYILNSSLMVSLLTAALHWEWSLCKQYMSEGCKMLSLLAAASLHHGILVHHLCRWSHSDWACLAYWGAERENTCSSSQWCQYPHIPQRQPEGLGWADRYWHVHIHCTCAQILSLHYVLSFGCTYKSPMAWTSNVACMLHSDCQ